MENLSKERTDRWSNLWCHYSELTEEQKDQDRKYADIVLSVVVEKIREAREEGWGEGMEFGHDVTKCKIDHEALILKVEQRGKEQGIKEERERLLTSLVEDMQKIPIYQKKMPNNTIDEPMLSKNKVLSLIRSKMEKKI